VEGFSRDVNFAELSKKNKKQEIHENLSPPETIIVSSYNFLLNVTHSNLANINCSSKFFVTYCTRELGFEGNKN